MNWRQKLTGEGRELPKQPKPPPTGQFGCRMDCVLLPIEGRLESDSPDPENMIEGATIRAATAYNLYFFIFDSWFLDLAGNQVKLYSRPVKNR